MIPSNAIWGCKQAKVPKQIMKIKKVDSATAQQDRISAQKEQKSHMIKYDFLVKTAQKRPKQESESTTLFS